MDIKNIHIKNTLKEGLIHYKNSHPPPPPAAGGQLSEVAAVATHG